MYSMVNTLHSGYNKWGYTSNIYYLFYIGNTYIYLSLSVVNNQQSPQMSCHQISCVSHTGNM